ncbi:cadherin-like domain-containing protein [Pararhizobium sp. DWP1-1-3]|uniref:cadherin-like domain-containing protein n=1 Tax=Pararhizobium sp. DWP1-1-3 TaxID=2804652 RepID=UPI003CEACCA8
MREGAMLAQNTGEIVGEGEIYTVRLNVGDRTDQDWPGGVVRIVLTKGGDSFVLASQALPVPANGSWTPVELNSPALTAAQALTYAGYQVRIEVQQTAGNGNQILIDNVELSTMPAMSDTGSLAINWGADNDPGLRSVAFDASLTNNTEVATANGLLRSNGAAVLLVRISATELIGVADDDNNGVVDANGRVIFRVTLDDGATTTDKGTWTFKLLDNIDHSAAANNASLGLSFGFSATDSDGDTIGGKSFTVALSDDSPVLVGPVTTGLTLNEDDLQYGTDSSKAALSVTGTLNIDLGADGGRVALSANGAGWDAGKSTLSALDGSWKIVVNGDGTYTFTLLKNTLLHGPDATNGENQLNLTINYLATDGDGDTLPGTFTIGIIDDVPAVIGAVQTGIVSETGLPLVSSTFGSLNVDLGADYKNSHASIGLNGNGTPIINPGLTSDGVALDYIVRTTNGVDQELVAFKQGDPAGATNPVFIVAVLHNGSFAATLYQNIDHANGSDPLILNMSARVYDGDGDYVDRAFAINIVDDVPVILGAASASNLLANGDFKAGDWSHAEYWGTWTTEDIGWKIEGTATGQADVRLERIASGYSGMTTSNSAPMVDLGATPGNVAISQTLTGLAAGKTYQVSFEAGSPNPGSSGLQVYWNGALVQTVAMTNEMKVITIDLVSAGTAGTITFKETGDPTDNTGTYLANIGLQEAGAVAAPVVSAPMSENETITVPFVEGTHFRFGADNAGHIQVGTASIAGPAGIVLQAPAIAYASGGFVITPGTAFDALGKGEIAKMTIPYTVIDGDGDKVVGSVVVTVTGTNDAPAIDLDTYTFGRDAEILVHEQMPMQFVSEAVLSDIDSPNLESMELTLRNFLNGAMEGLALNDRAKTIAEDSGLDVIEYNSVTGILKIIGSAPVGTYEAILKNILYVNNDENTTAGDRTVTVVVNDGIGNSAEQIATLHVTALNDAPTIEGGTMTAVVAEGGSFTLSPNELKYHDWDDNAAGVTFFVSNVLHGTITNGGAPATSFTAAELEAGLIRFNHDGSEGSAASFNVMVEDGNEDQNGPAPAVFPFNLTVTPVNDGKAPITLTDTTQTAGAPKVGDVLQVALGADPDGEKTNVAYQWLRDGSTITNATGATYTLGASDTGHAISVRATYIDGQSFSETVTSVATAAVVTNNTAPDAANDRVVTNQGYVQIPDWVLLLNDSDAEHNNLTITNASGASGGLVFDDNGTVNFWDFFASDNGSFGYAVSDGTSTDTATVTVVDDYSGALDGSSNAEILIDGDTGTSIYGKDGNDVLLGNGGNDDLYGGAGSDRLYGGSGEDWLFADASDLVIDGGTGTDTLKIAGNFTSVSDEQIVNVERVDLTAAAVLNLTNQTEGFKILGSSGIDTITGGTGNDTINGGGGNDVINLSAANTDQDQIRFATNAGSDTVNGFIAGRDKIAFLDGNSQGAVNFNNTLGSSAGATLNSADFRTATSIAAIGQSSHNDVIVITTAQTQAQILAASSTAGNSYVVVYNSNAGAAQIWFDTDWGTGGAASRSLIATLNGVTAAQVAALTRADFVAYNSATDPIILDLDHNGFAFSSLDHGVTFDIDADGKADKVAWTSTDGILAYDIDGNGKIDNGTEIFTPSFAGGNHAGGVAALATLDSNGDGKIDADDNAFSKLSIWIDANNNGISDAGELSSLADNHVASISLCATSVDGLEDGQSVLAEGTFTFDNGSNGHFIEVGFDTIVGDGSFGTAGDDILAGGLAHMTMMGGAGADTFVLDSDAFKGIDLADVITDYKAGEGDVLDVSSLLTSLLGHDASEADALASVKTTVSGADTVVSVNDNGAWHDVAVLQDYTSTVKVLYDDDHNATAVSHTV